MKNATATSHGNMRFTASMEIAEGTGAAAASGDGPALADVTSFAMRDINATATSVQSAQMCLCLFHLVRTQQNFVNPHAFNNLNILLRNQPRRRPKKITLLIDSPCPFLSFPSLIVLYCPSAPSLLRATPFPCPPTRHSSLNLDQP
jgi:hypothetical protein